MNMPASPQIAIIVAIGAAGRQIVQLVEESNPVNDLPIHYVILDTIPSSSVNHRSVPLQLTEDEWDAYLNEPAKRGVNTDSFSWYEPSLLRLQERGANSKVESRMYARLLLMHPTNAQKLAGHLNQIVRPTPRPAADGRRAPVETAAIKASATVFIVGDLGDALCSGIVADLGLFLDQELADVKALRCGIFLFPDGADAETARNNAYQAIRELNHFDYLAGTRRTIDLRSRTSHSSSAPYDMSYVIVPPVTFHGGNLTPARTAAECLLNIIPLPSSPYPELTDYIFRLREASTRVQLESTRQARIYGQLPAFSMLQCSTVQYPEAQALHERLSAQATREIVRSWLSPDVKWDLSSTSSFPFEFIQVDDEQRGVVREALKTANNIYGTAWSLFEPILEDGGRSYLQEFFPPEDTVEKISATLEIVGSFFSFGEFSATESYASRTLATAPSNQAKPITVDLEARQQAEAFADHLTQAFRPYLESYLFQSNFGPKLISLAIAELKHPSLIEGPDNTISGISLEHTRRQNWISWHENFRQLDGLRKETVSNGAEFRAFEAAHKELAEARDACYAIETKYEHSRADASRFATQRDATVRECQLAKQHTIHATSRSDAALRGYEEAKDHCREPQRRHQAAVESHDKASAQKKQATINCEDPSRRYVEAARRNEEAQRRLKDANDDLNSAQRQIDVAKLNHGEVTNRLEQARKQRKDLWWQFWQLEALDADIKNAEAALQLAEITIRDADTNMRSAKSGLQAAQNSAIEMKNRLQDAQNVHQANQNALMEAERHESETATTRKSTENTLHEAKMALEDAGKSLRDAQEANRQAEDTLRAAESALKTAEGAAQNAKSQENKLSNDLDRAREAFLQAEAILATTKEVYVFAVREITLAHALAGFKLATLDHILFDGQFGKQLADRLEPIENFLQRFVSMVASENESQAPPAADLQVTGFGLPDGTDDVLKEILKDRISKEAILSTTSQQKAIESLRSVEMVQRAVYSDALPAMTEDLAREIIDTVRAMVKVMIRKDSIKVDDLRKKIDDIAWPAMVQGSIAALRSVPISPSNPPSFETAMVFSNDPHCIEQRPSLLTIIDVPYRVIPSNHNDRIAFAVERHGLYFTQLAALLKVGTPPFLDTGCSRRDIQWLQPGVSSKWQQDVEEIWLLTLLLKEQNYLCGDIGWHKDSQYYYLDFSDGGQTVSCDFDAAIVQLTRGEQRRTVELLSYFCRDSLSRLSREDIIALPTTEPAEIGARSHEEIKKILQISILKHESGLPSFA